MFCSQVRLILGTQYFSGYLKKITRSARFFTTFVQACTKSPSKAYERNYVSEFPLLSELKLALCGLVVFTDMKMYILIEGRNFKTYLNENYSIALGSCQFFPKTSYFLGIEHHINSAYGVFIYQTILAVKIKDEFDSLLVCHITRFFIICLQGSQISFKP